MLFSKKPTKERLRQYKTVKISGMKFVIQKLNPLVDFTADKMPQIYTAYISRRKPNPEQQVSEATLRKSNEDIKNIISAGLVPDKIDQDINIEDIMSDSYLALKLYTEILAHSLNMYKGLRGLFFSAKIKRLLHLEYQKNLEKLLMK